MSNFDIHTHIQ